MSTPPAFTVRATLSDVQHTFRSLPTTYVSRRSTGTSVSEIEVFCCRSVHPSDVDIVIKFITLPDSGSEINLVSETSIPHLRSQAIKSRVITIAGIGYSGRPLRSESKIKLSLHLRSGTPAVEVWCYIISDAAIPQGVDLLLGKPFLKQLSIKPDPTNQRLEIGSLNLIVHTMPVSRMVSTFSAAPLRFLEICGGASFSYHTLRNLGYDFEIYHSIELDPKARAVARAHSNAAVHHPLPHDLLLQPDSLTESYTDILVTTECGPWSRASGPKPPRGFLDPRAQLFIKACAIIHDQRSRNPRLNTLFENVDIHPAIAKTEGPEQERLLGEKFHVVNAKDLGNMSSRPRRLASNMALPDQLTLREPPPASFAIGAHNTPICHPMFCLVSKEKTWNRQQCFDSVTHALRDLTGDERDVYMGHVSGSSRHALLPNGATVTVSENYRRELLGKGICEAHVEAYFAHRDNNDHHYALPCTMSAKITEASPEQAELFLSDMDFPALCEWFKNNSLSGYKLLQLRLKMDESNGLPQVKANYGQGGKLDASMTHALQLMVTADILEEVENSPDQMVSPCFPKLKPGRTFEDRPDLSLVRVLADLRSVNLKIISDDPDEWMHVNPTRNGATHSVPIGTCWYGDIDLHDAFHHGRVHKSSRRYLVIYWKGKYYMYKGCPQGLKVASGFFMMLMIDLLNQAVGGAWNNTTPPIDAQGDTTSPRPLPYSQPWWIGYCDDWMPIADTRVRCENRQRILRAILKVMNLPLSPKCKGDAVSQMGSLIGLNWTVNGHCLSDDAVASLMTALELQPKTITDAKAIIGLINYSESAFTYSPHEQARHGTLMTILSDSVNLDNRLRWGDDAKRAIQELSLRMQNLPRKTYDPVQLFATNDYIIVILGDASKTGAGSSIYLVAKQRAEDFDKADLTAPTTLLVDCYHKVLSDTQKKWQTYETESWIMVKSVKKWFKYIARALYTRTHWQHSKILMLSDSTTAAAKWHKITLPQYDLDYICAKARRFLSWADQVAYTADWPLITNHLPGEFNSLAHLLSHVGDLLTAMYENPPPGLPERPKVPSPPVDKDGKRIRQPSRYTPPVDPPFDSHLLNGTPESRRDTLKVSSLFISLHSYHGDRPAISTDFAEPPNFTVNHLNVPVDQLRNHRRCIHAGH